ncbi:hypothetical protein LTR12_002986 [Friedmanniomyces endolithicus]|nr:hypothetical protein LTR12_002986 [Friedmanniomyces endolithicus]
MDDNMFNDLLASGGSPGGAGVPQGGPQGGPAQNSNVPPGMPPGPTGGAPTPPDPGNNGLGTSGADTDVKMLSRRYFDLLIQREVPTAVMMRTIQHIHNAIRREGEGARPMLERRIRQLGEDVGGGFEPGGFGMQGPQFHYGPGGGYGGYYGGFGYHGGFGGYGF